MLDIKKKREELLDLEVEGLSRKEKVSLLREKGEDLSMSSAIERENKKFPSYFISISEKIKRLANTNCAYCDLGRSPGDDSSVRSFPVDINIFSKQSKKENKKNREKDIDDYFSKYPLESLGDADLCVKFVFCLNEDSKDKDVDNMSKWLLDILEGKLFVNDSQVQHLSAYKIITDKSTEYVYVSIQRSYINEHDLNTLIPIHNSSIRYGTVRD